MARFTFITDPGHGWLAVSLAEYPDAINYGTGFGYIDGHVIYLEEDCEAPAFMAAHGFTRDNTDIVPLEFAHDDWPGRSLPHNVKKLEV